MNIMAKEFTTEDDEGIVTEWIVLYDERDLTEKQANNLINTWCQVVNTGCLATHAKAVFMKKETYNNVFRSLKKEK